MAVRNAQLYEDLQLRADRDSLTELLNHRAFYDRLEAELARACRSGGSRRRGGDRPRRLQGPQRLARPPGRATRVLREAAAALTATSREGDVIGRRRR